MIHSWRVVMRGWNNQLPLAKFLLGVRVGEFVPAIYRYTNREGVFKLVYRQMCTVRYSGDEEKHTYKHK